MKKRKKEIRNHRMKIYMLHRAAIKVKRTANSTLRLIMVA